MSQPLRPSLFDYATKELSQDAMICWLLRWADPRYADIDRGLHECGRAFVTALLRQHQVTDIPEHMRTVGRVFQQDKGIDVLARVSDDHVLLVEDKTGSSDHSGQLRRYYNHVAEGRTKLGDVAKETVYPIYLKTGNQSRSQDVTIEQDDRLHRSYRVFNRTAFLEVLRSYRGSDPILKDYKRYLEQWERDTNGFRCWRQDGRSGWSWRSWEGFFRQLEDRLSSGGWGYVPNAAGGFLGFHWGWLDLADEPGAVLYLQLEVVPEDPGRQLLCFKVGGARADRRQDLKWTWHDAVLKAGGKRVEKPPVMRVGDTMTVARWVGAWLAFDADGRLDLDATLEHLLAAGKILKQAAHQAT